jgi:alpha-glucosidase
MIAYRKALSLVSLLLLITIISTAQKKAADVSSPDGRLKVFVWIDEAGRPIYSVSQNNEEILRPSRLGLIREDGNFAESLTQVKGTLLQKVTDQYSMTNAKKKNIRYAANKMIFRFQNANKETMEIIFQVSNDGVAFRYYFPTSSPGIKKITSEQTTYHFPLTAKAWLQPMQVAKTGFEKSNPAYEEHYKQNISVGTPSPTAAGWIYPALFQSGNSWVLITESSLDSNYCGTRLKSESPDGEYAVGFPDPREIFPGGGTIPQSKLPFYSPWRIITIGSLKTIIESTLGTDLAKPAIKGNFSFVKPGKSSWSWIMSKDDSIVYSEQIRYIDFAADMKWQYALVDANWDQKIGYEKARELATYANSKGVGLLLWYNSSGDWNTVNFTPKSKLLTREDRMKEFTRLKEMGIKGVKIDFFGGDGQSVIKYYIDIMEDAAKVGIMVNFHGATLPRGWARTYPNFVTAEAVRGFEMITFGQNDANAEANHCAMLPFTRNAFDPMDFTPMNLYKIPTRVRRKTTSAFELATSVLFLSGIQHFAESPAGMAQMPDYIKEFLRFLPTHWEDVRFLDGFPGKHVVIARKSGNGWFIGGINGEEVAKTIEVDLSSFKAKKALMYTDGTEPLSFTEVPLDLSKGMKQSIKVQPNGGFVIIMK